MKMKNKDILKIGAIIFLVFALVWIFRAVYLEDEAPENSGGRRDNHDGIAATEILEGLSIETLEGETTSLEALEGTPIIITLWEEEDADSRAQVEILENLALLLEEEVAFLTVRDPEDLEVPHTFIIDQWGWIFEEYSGLTTEEVLLADVEALLERDEF